MLEKKTQRDKMGKEKRVREIRSEAMKSTNNQTQDRETK